ncbi:MAG: methyltransferase domain-containing protein [Alphaproteobacteria bacterium]|nr:methyltransferase domain-containing protein [Alphaproteobacteria bacterium]
MTLLLTLVACATHAPAEPPPQAPAEHHAPGDHAPEHHGDHATVTHGFEDVERWSAVFDDPARDAWQKPAELVAALDLPAGAVVADIGAGTGYFNAHLARAVGPEGKVIAVDIEPGLVAHMAARAEAEETPQVEARLGQPDDPALQPGEVDLVLLVDTYHHIDGRVDYFTRLRDDVRDGGRLVVVDFKPGELPVGPPPEHRLAPETVQAELEQAGWQLSSAPELLPYQFVHIYGVGR